MIDSDSHFDAFEAHTLLKHAVYSNYLQRWGRIMLSRSGPRTLRIVDACAGRGEDVAGNPGSPLIAIREAGTAARQLSAGRTESVRVALLAIEKNPANLASLKAAVGRTPRDEHVYVEVVPGTLADHIDRIERRPHPTLFFIDPFGIEPLDAALIRRALAGRRNEVLLLFFGQAALRHTGAYAAGERVLSPEPTLFGEVEPPRMDTLSHANRQRVRGGERSEEILDAAFGELEWREVLKLDSRRRLPALLDMYARMLRSFGASHVLTIPIINPQAYLKYHLVHASRHPRAYAVMKDSAHRAWGKSRVGGTAVRMAQLAVEQTRIEPIADYIIQKFAGQDAVPWDASSSRPSVKQTALAETEFWPRQGPELREALKPYRTGGLSAKGRTYPDQVGYSRMSKGPDPRQVRPVPFLLRRDALHRTRDSCLGLRHPASRDRNNEHVPRVIRRLVAIRVVHGHLVPRRSCCRLGNPVRDYPPLNRVRHRSTFPVVRNPQPAER